MTSDMCRICHGVDVRRFDAYDYRWIRCKECKSIQKLITEDEYRALNPTYDPGHYLDSLNPTEIESYLNVGGETDRIRYIHDRYLQNREDLSLLDVGCGMGGYLIGARRLGFKVLGFEPSADHARIAKEIFSLSVINDYYSPEKVSEKFNIIMLSQVIEHIYHPGPFLGRLVQALKPGGVLAILTPNTESAAARVCGRYWTMLRPVDHVSLLSASTFEYFKFSTPVEIGQEWGQFPYAFAATLLASLKNRLRGARAVTTHGTKVSGLRDMTFRGKALQAGLTVMSLPTRALPSSSQDCLLTFICSTA